MSFKFVLAAFLAYFLKIETKWALLSLFLEVLGGSSRQADGEEVDGEVVNSKVVYSKDTGSRKVVSEKVCGFLADFILYIF